MPAVSPDSVEALTYSRFLSQLVTWGVIRPLPCCLCYPVCRYHQFRKPHCVGRLPQHLDLRNVDTTPSRANLFCGKRRLNVTPRNNVNPVHRDTLDGCNELEICILQPELGVFAAGLNGFLVQNLSSVGSPSHPHHGCLSVWFWGRAL